jgi:ATP-dependent exoDNAse (exonuclease V) alpha subunit
LLHQSDDPERDLVDAWRKSGGLILAGSNDEVERLNREVQATREVTGTPMVHRSGHFLEGDRVLFTKNHAKLDVFNGDLGTVVSGKGSVATVALDRGTTVTVDLDQYESLRLGYAVTTHKAQGLTTDATLIVTGPMQDRELTYVQASRARFRTEFFSSDEPFDQLGGRMNRSRRKLLASDLGPELSQRLHR